MPDDLPTLPDWLMPDQPTPALLLAALLVFVLLSALTVCLVRAVLVLLRPVVAGMDALRLYLQTNFGDRLRDRWPRSVRLLEREAAELLLLAAALAALAASSSGLIVLAFAVVQDAPLVRLDTAVFEWLQRGRDAAVDTVMVAITEMGGARVTVTLGLAVFAWLAWRRAWAPALYWAVALIGARACVVALKVGFERARPASIYGGVESFSFPSGHATSSMVTFGFLAFLLCVRQRWRLRIPVLVLASTLIAAIGLSRLYLGMHWLSDVLAGYSLGLAWIVLLATLYLTLHRPGRLPARQLGTVALAALVIAGGWVMLMRLPEAVERYREVRSVKALSAPPCAGAVLAGSRVTTATAFCRSGESRATSS